MYTDEYYKRLNDEVRAVLGWDEHHPYSDFSGDITRAWLLWNEMHIMKRLTDEQIVDIFSKKNSAMSAAAICEHWLELQKVAKK